MLAGTATQGPEDPGVPIVISDPTPNLPRVCRIQAMESWACPLRLNGIKTAAILDTGASISLMSRAVYEQMPKSMCYPRQGPKVLRAAGNHALTTLGSVLCDVTIAGHHYPWEIYVSTENETVGCLLGMDFMFGNRCELVLHSGHLKVNGMSVKLLRVSDTPDTIARIR